MITNRIYEWARTQPAKIAMIHNDQPCSYAVFARAIEVTRIFFKDQSPPAGRTAIVCISNLADAWIVILGLRSIGLTTICVNSLATAKALNIKGVACIVMAEADRALDKLEEQTWAGVRVIVVPRALYANIHTGDIAHPSSDTPPFGGHIVYTSGTTGSYKKILIKGETEEKRNVFWADHELFDSRTVVFSANFGPWSGAGFYWPSATWNVGGCVVLDQSPELFLRSFRHRITYAWLTPPMLKSVLERCDASTDLAEFELSIGGGFLSLDLAQRAVNQLTKNVSAYYGSTEHLNTMRSRFRSADDLHWLSHDAGSTFEIVDQNGDACPIDREGELRARLRDNDATSYLDDEEASRKFFREGYFYPGDIAVRRADCRIRVLGRTADVLNVQGRKIAVAPIEQKIQDLLGASAVCLFSLLSDDGKDELVVAIEANKFPQKSRLDKIYHEFRLFERIRLEVLQEFPRTEAGTQKIKRTELRKMIVGKGAGAGSDPN